jgi:ATP-dependent Clp protease ATP-binding subunit ClpC
LVKLVDRINQLGYQIIVSDPAKDFIAEKGYDSKYGARPLNRAIQKYVEDLLAENVVNNAIKEGDKILVDQNKKGDNLQLKINQKVETS